MKAAPRSLHLKYRTPLPKLQRLLGIQDVLTAFFRKMPVNDLSLSARASQSPELHRISPGSHHTENLFRIFQAFPLHF
jgi:hypothetical protein